MLLQRRSVRPHSLPIWLLLLQSLCYRRTLEAVRFLLEVILSQAKLRCSVESNKPMWKLLNRHHRWSNGSGVVIIARH